MSFHGEGGEASLVDAARAVSGISTLFPVHRLDRITSGLVLLARSEAAAKQLSEMFARGEMEKYYLALSHRSPLKKQGSIKGAMVKGRNGSWRLAREGEHQAVTQFFSYGLVGAVPGLRLFVLRPRTGRTHQLRVALKSLGSPILGDERYGGEAADRGYLHAAVLRFQWQGTQQCFEAPPTEGEHFLSPALTEKLAAIGPAWLLPWPRSQATSQAKA
ncbi:MAG: RNA pseudouridine synthase [Rhodocyclaceae bacterium]|nr:MAG: RNA pseudouridine synthase [Rhodocyclaceae bacterium]